MAHDDIRIGTLCPADRGIGYLKAMLEHGFESVQINFWTKVTVDLKSYAKQVREALGDQAVCSSLGMYGNPLMHKDQAKAFAQCIDRARDFGCDLVCGFAGAIDGKPVPESMKAFKKVWGELARRAEDRGVRIAFENCEMGGTYHAARWNIAHASTTWEQMFNEVPSPALGLEWEPCHQMVSLVDPLPQLRKWVHRIYHVHGKDATLDWATIREYGIHSGKPYVYHRTPGFGDTNWTDVISILRMARWKGSIDIEGWHDPVYKDELETTGQVHALHYLKQCRGGVFVPNPPSDAR
ncbi:MAG: sugar phosphate isomerase/epimerase family protein [Tepidisphaerales bacterium]